MRERERCEKRKRTEGGERRERCEKVAVSLGWMRKHPRTPFTSLSLLTKVWAKNKKTAPLSARPVKQQIIIPWTFRIWWFRYNAAGTLIAIYTTNKRFTNLYVVKNQALTCRSKQDFRFSKSSQLEKKDLLFHLNLYNPMNISLGGNSFITTVHVTKVQRVLFPGNDNFWRLWKYLLLILIF